MKKAQPAMPRPEIGGAPSERAANLDYVRADRAQEPTSERRV
jgi:hypothetical protein